jgi:anti-anti-sigma factor
MLSIIQQPEAQRIVFKFDGKLDTLACQGLNDEINRQWESLKTNAATGATTPSEIVFDLEQVTFVSSAFIRLCNVSAQKVEPGKFSIINCDPLIKKTFKISGLEDRFKVQ